MLILVLYQGRDTLRLDLESGCVRIGERDVELTPTEFNLLACLVQNRGSAVSRATLLDSVWENESKPGSRTVDAHVRRLRKKLGRLGRVIQSVRGVGYQLEL